MLIWLLAGSVPMGAYLILQVSFPMPMRLRDRTWTDILTESEYPAAGPAADIRLLLPR